MPVRNLNRICAPKSAVVVGGSKAGRFGELAKPAASHAGAMAVQTFMYLVSYTGTRDVLYETAPDNRRLIGMFERRGFQIDRSVSSDVLLVRKEL